MEALADAPLLAVDTESNSMYVYREQVCLIQLSTRDKDYIIDPLAIDNLTSFGTLMADDAIEKVFHAAEYDITCLKRDFDYTFRNLFDTMVAARICGFKSIGLASMLETYAGVRMDKRHQLDNWGARPLPEDSLIYAQMDTHYLPYLRDELQQALTTRGHLSEAQEAFEDVCQTPAASPRGYNPDGFWKVGRPNRLKRREMMILREVYTVREEIAMETNRPPFKILNNKALVAISRRSPNNRRELREVRGVSAAQVRRYGDEILDAIERGRDARNLPKPPPNPMPDPVVTERYNALHSWRKARADRRGVESDVIVPKQTLWHLAHKDPSTVDELQNIHGLGPWRLQTYGREILDVLRVAGE